MLVAEMVKAHTFEDSVDEWVLVAVAQGASSFEELLALLPGVYPSVALASLRRLAAANQLSRKVVFQVETSLSATAAGAIGRVRKAGLLPHPLDYEWRFTDSAAEYLLGRCLTYSVPGDTLVFLGVPSVFAAALDQGTSSRQLVLADFNRRAIQALSDPSGEASLVTCDLLRGETPPVTGCVTVIDPPWYPEHITSFLRAAAQITSPGGYVLASLPPEGTRPGMQEEWQALLDDARRFNLHLVELRPLALPYETPFFEANALRAAGFAGIPSTWRRGDLAIFSVTGKTALPPLVASQQPEVWDEQILGGVRVRVRVRSNEKRAFADPSMQTLLPGDILPTVSRRDPRRERADVWTSGNRVFRCGGPEVLRVVLAAEASGAPVDAAVAAALGRGLTPGEKELVFQASRQIQELARIEQDEIALYVG